MLLRTSGKSVATKTDVLDSTLTSMLRSLRRHSPLRLFFVVCGDRFVSGRTSMNRTKVLSAFGKIAVCKCQTLKDLPAARRFQKIGGSLEWLPPKGELGSLIPPAD